jgi:hypothetical protein
VVEAFFIFVLFKLVFWLCHWQFTDCRFAVCIEWCGYEVARKCWELLVQWWLSKACRGVNAAVT